MFKKSSPTMSAEEVSIVETDHTYNYTTKDRSHMFISFVQEAGCQYMVKGCFPFSLFSLFVDDITQIRKTIQLVVLIPLLPFE